VFVCLVFVCFSFYFFFQAEDGIRDRTVTGVQTCALPISVVDYLAKNFSTTTPKPDPNGRLSRTLLQGAAAKYIAVDFEGPNLDAAWHDVTVDPRGIAWVNQLNEYKIGKFDPRTFEFTEIPLPPGPRKVG